MSAAKKPGPWKRFKRWLHGVPHLFAKLTIIYCIACATGASAYAFRAQAAGASMEGLLGVVLGFFGGELMLLCLKTVLKKKAREDHDENYSDEADV